MRGVRTANSTPWQTVVTVEAGGDWPTRINIAKPGGDRELTQALQLELKRVHCYDGPIDGEWLLQSKRAMRAFLDRVNASLPIDKPDRILLTLIKGHVDAACGQVCPEGQSLAANGRCLPTPTVPEDRSTVATNDNGPGDATAPPIPLSGAMLAGGPRSEPEKQSYPPPERAGTIENLFIHPLGRY